MANELVAGNRKRDNRRLFTRLSVIAVAMFGFGYALVPFCDELCQALGIDSLVGRDGVEKSYPGKATLTLESGEVVVVETPGGGGWGQPEG